MANTTYHRPDDWEQHRTIMDGLHAQIRRLEKQKDDFVRETAEKAIKLDKEREELGKQRDALVEEGVMTVAGIDAHKAHLRDQLKVEARNFSASFGRSTPEVELKPEPEVVTTEEAMATETQILSDHNDQVRYEDEADGQETMPGREDSVVSTGAIESGDLFVNAFGSHADTVEDPLPAPPASKRGKLSPDHPVGSLKSYAMISNAHPTIIRAPEEHRWVELRCFRCGINASYGNRRFLSGIEGLRQHLIRTHKSQVEKKWDLKDLVARCTVKRFTDAEADAILNGKKGAYVVPMVRMPT